MAATQIQADVDFLPIRYREKKTERKNRYWQGAVIAGFVALLAAGAVGQYRLARGVSEQLEIATRQQTATMSESTKLAVIQSQLAEANATAALYTYLRHPWPRSRLLLLVASHVPEGITLSSVAVEREGSTEAVALSLAPTPSADPSAAESAVKPPKAQRDLDRLRKELDRGKTVVVVEGYAREVTQLHEMLKSLGTESLFTRAEVASVERGTTSLAAYHFKVRLTVLPGYTQPGGPPTGKPAELTSAR